MAALNLDPRKIISSINEFCQEKYGKSPIIEPATFPEREKRFVPEIRLDSKSCKLMICFNNSGKTSIVAQGKDASFGKELKNYIEKVCLVSDDLAYSFSIPYTDGMFNSFLSFLKDECHAEEKLQTKEETGILYHFEAAYSDKLTMHKYSNGNLFIQGKRLWLSQQINYYFSNNNKYIDIVKAQNDRFNISFDKSKIDTLFASVFEGVRYEKLPNDMEIMLKTALGFTLVNVENLPDYSSFVYPALRSLESFLQDVLSKNCDNYGDEDDIGGYFTKQYPSFAVKVEYRCKKITNENQRFLGDIYELYNKERNVLFHTNTPTNETKFIERNKADADNLVMDICSKLKTGINSFY